MNDPSAAVLAALNTACAAHPEQRVSQVIVNALGPDPFHLSDDATMNLLLAYAAHE